jgi:hypothetical protein
MDRAKFKFNRVLQTAEMMDFAVVHLRLRRNSPEMNFTLCLRLPAIR